MVETAEITRPRTPRTQSLTSGTQRLSAGTRGLNQGTTLVAIAALMFVVIAALTYVLPTEHLAFVEIVPLVLLTRACGLRVSILTALAAAAPLNILQHRLRPFSVTLWQNLAEVAVLFAIFAVILWFIDRYEHRLARSYRKAEDRASAESARLEDLSTRLPVALRAEGERLRERDLVTIAETLPQLIWRADVAGKTEYANEAWHQYTGIDVATMLEHGLRTSCHPDDLQRMIDCWNDAQGKRAAYQVEVRIRRHDGVYRWHVSRATPLTGADGSVVGWFGSCTDIDDQKRAHQSLEKRFESAHRVSEAFQEASLPATLPTVPGVCFSALYRAGRREAAVGGDWYDALRLLDGRVVISIGDVSGSGLRAAITMVAMRQAIRGAAHIHADPLAILESADRTLRQDSPESMVTAFVGVYDPVTRSLQYAGAGHPPPLIRRRDGTIFELTAPGLPLGVRRKGDTEAGEVVLEVGSTLVLYTDGLIESTHDILAGMRRLRDAVNRVGSQPKSRIADLIASVALAGGASDDVAILTLSLEAESNDTRYQRWTFDSSDRFAAREVHKAFVTALVASGANEDQVCDAEVVFSELLGNVVRHSRGACDIVLDSTHTLPVLSILDRGRGFTHAGYLPADAFAESGRGLFIVRSLTAEFNASRRPGGGTHARAVLYVNRLASTPKKRRELAVAVA